jgi:hypothetical protein
VASYTEAGYNEHEHTPKEPKMRDPRKPLDRDLYDILNPVPEWGEYHERGRWDDDFTPPPEDLEDEDSEDSEDPLTRGH